MAWVGQPANPDGFLVRAGKHQDWLRDQSYPVLLLAIAPLRPLEEIRADILAVERETEGLLSEIVGER